MAGVGNHDIEGSQKATNNIKSGFIASAVNSMVVTTICVCGPSSRIIFFSGVSSFVLFPGWQLGEVQLYYGVIFICFFEISAGMIYFYQEIKGGDF